MNVVGYLITLANLQSFQQSGGPLKDLSIQVGEVKKLADEMRSHPEFTLESFKQSGYAQSGDVGKYMSQNLRNYMFHGNVNPKDEGVILTLNYAKNLHLEAAPVSTTKDEDGTLSYFVHKSADLEEHERKNLYRYLDAVKNRNKRDVTVYEKAMVN